MKLRSSLFGFIATSLSFLIIVACGQKHTAPHAVNKPYEGVWVDKVAFDSLMAASSSAADFCQQPALRAGPAVTMETLKVSGSGRVEVARHVSVFPSIAYVYAGDVDGSGNFKYSTEYNPLLLASDVEIQKHEIKYKTQNDELTIHRDILLKHSGDEQKFNDLYQYRKLSEKDFDVFTEKVRRCLRSNAPQQKPSIDTLEA